MPKNLKNQCRVLLKKLVGNPYKWLIFPFYAIGLIASKLTGIGCVWKELTGFICPGCGFTRATLAALKLDFAAAFRWHPMFWCLPILAVFFLRDGIFTGKKNVDIAVFAVIAVGIFVSWAARLHLSYMY